MHAGHGDGRVFWLNLLVAALNVALALGYAIRPWPLARVVPVVAWLTVAVYAVCTAILALR